MSDIDVVSSHTLKQETCRLVRLLRLYWALAAHPHGTLRRDLADRFGISERRIQDDLIILRAAGIAIRRRSTGYVLEVPQCRF